MKINNVEVTENDYIELAKWAHHLENENRQLKLQNEELKTNLLAVVHQRNSLHRRHEDLKNQQMLDNMNTIQTELVINSELENPEQYRVAEYKPQKKDIN